jgi:Flp pilus assembly protein TadG
VTRARSLAQRLHDDRGVVATAIALFPVFAAVVFMFVQGAFWQLDVQAARAAADKASEAAAMYGHSSGEAEALARQQMASAGIGDISVIVSKGDDYTVVDVSGTAPGLLPGMSISVTAHSETPTERFRQ